MTVDPALASGSVGEQFARAVAANAGADVRIELPVALPAVFPLAAHRPRYTVRHLVRSATVAGEPVSYVAEPPAAGPDTAGARYADTPEAAFVPRFDQAGLTAATATVPLPGGLLDDPVLLARHVDYRVVVRLCTVENEVLLRGSADGAVTGLLRLPALRRRTTDRPLDEQLTAAAADVEEMGGSCDGVVAHPRLYWQLVHSGLLGRLADAGVRVSRTRMIEPGRALLGDFRAAVTLLETGTSELALRRGAAPGCGDLVEATVRIGLAVHLPQHFLLLETAGGATAGGGAVETLGGGRA